jgi:uncharacterized protein (TIGR03382 family)
MKRVTSLAIVVALGGAGMAEAAIIGTESFTYPDNTSIVGQAGGSGWDLDGNGTVSPWQPYNTNQPPVISGQLVTGWGNRDRASRRFGNSDEPNGNYAGYVQGTGQVYFGVDVLMEAGTQTAGISWVDGGSERKTFGLVNETGRFGLANDWYNTANAEVSNLQVVFGQTYRIVGRVDYTAPDASRVALWVNPTPGSEAAPLITGAANAFWMSGVDLYSGGVGDTVSTRWDNLVVATTFAEAVVPEPSSLALGALALLGLGRRRRG